MITDAPGLIPFHDTPGIIPFDNMEPTMNCWTMIDMSNTKLVSFGVRRHIPLDGCPTPVGTPADWDEVAMFMLKTTNNDKEVDVGHNRFFLGLVADWAIDQDCLLENPVMKAGLDWLIEQLQTPETRMVDYLKRDRLMMDRVMFLVFHFIREVGEDFWTWLITSHQQRNEPGFAEVATLTKRSVMDSQARFKRTDECHHMGFQISTHHIGIHLWGNKDSSTPGTSTRNTVRPEGKEEGEDPQNNYGMD